MMGRSSLEHILYHNDVLSAVPQQLLMKVGPAVESKFGQVRFACQTCPYIYNINKKISTSAILKRKEIDDVLGGEDAWKNVQKTDVACPSCQHPQAYFKEIQTRSADEPATLFFKCAKCEHQWKEG